MSDASRPNAFRIFGEEAGEGTLVLSAGDVPTEGALVEVTGTVVEVVVEDVPEQ